MKVNIIDLYIDELQEKKLIRTWKVAKKPDQEPWIAFRLDALLIRNLHILGKPQKSSFFSGHGQGEV